MTARELDALLKGEDGLVVVLKGPSGFTPLELSRYELGNPVAFRAAWRRVLAHTGWEAPVYDQEDHDTIVRVMFRLADACEPTPEGRRWQERLGTKTRRPPPPPPARRRSKRKGRRR